MRAGEENNNIERMREQALPGIKYHGMSMLSSAGEIGVMAARHRRLIMPIKAANIYGASLIMCRPRRAISAVSSRARVVEQYKCAGVVLWKWAAKIASH